MSMFLFNIDIGLEFVEGRDWGCSIRRFCRGVRISGHNRRDLVRVHGKVGKVGDIFFVDGRFRTLGGCLVKTRTCT